ncbi:MAG: NADH-quinone oxidoreductase subunit NuoH [Chitinophagales bacterium]|jgi:NADH-quinone oxidoreductase subunit H|nr:NADH-quinone oxidoreductase subunit NuoH [Chitinophagales bacterium]
MSLFLLFDWALAIEKIILVSVVFAITLGVAAYSTWGERKVAAFMQDRMGPSRAGWGGILQPIADGVKMFTKEDFMPNQAERWLYILAPGAFMFVAAMTSAVIPWGTELTIFDKPVTLQVADLNIGILYIMGFVSLGVYGIMMGGWASNNKYSLYGAIRASSQMISYELAMGLSVIAVVMMTGTLSLKEMAIQQPGINWNIWYQPLGFLIFFVCALAECNRAPFDLAECETELIGGYHTEYSSMKLGFFLFAEYINMFVSSAVISTVYFGGYNFPGIDPGWLYGFAGPLVLFAKIFFFIFVFMWIRWTLPRFRYDQLMHLGWKSLIPLAILNMLLTGLGVLLFSK